MPGEDTTIIPGQQRRVSVRRNEPVTTIGGVYAVGDTRTKPPGYIKIVGDDIEKWQAGFDKIDIAPKDGQLSLDEVCAYRDKQVRYARFALWANPKNWFNPKKIEDLSLKFSADERETERYRGN